MPSIRAPDQITTDSKEDGDVEKERYADREEFLSNT